MPLKSGFPATRPTVSAGAAGAARVGRPVTSVKKPAVAAAADIAIAKLLPESRIGVYPILRHTTTIGCCFEAVRVDRLGASSGSARPGASDGGFEIGSVVGSDDLPELVAR
jgi:hypothetical protein